MDEKQYAESLLPEDPELEQVKASIRDNQVYDISVPAGYGKLLTLLVKISGAKNVLEIGALAGYSGICLARGFEGKGRLTSLELNEEYIQLAKTNLERAGFGECVEYRAGDAVESLKQLYAEGRRFDFFFIDADKINYSHYLDWALKLALPGAVIAGDNAFIKGKVYQEQFEGNSIQAMRSFNHRMLNDERLEGVLLPAYDGLAIARVKAGS